MVGYTAGRHFVSGAIPFFIRTVGGAGSVMRELASPLDWVVEPSEMVPQTNQVFTRIVNGGAQKWHHRRHRVSLAVGSTSASLWQGRRSCRPATPELMQKVSTERRDDHHRGDVEHACEHAASEAKHDAALCEK